MSWHMISKPSRGATVVDEEVVLERGKKGKGKIKYESTPGSIFLDFEIPHDQLACYAKRDRLQHPFIEIIHGLGHQPAQV